VKAFFRRWLPALALVAGVSAVSSAQVAKSTGVPAQQQPGTVIVNSPSTTSQPTQRTTPQYPTQSTSYPTQQSAPVYTGQNQTRVQQIDARLDQIRQERDRLRQEEQALRQERGQLTGQAAQYQNREHHDNGKHKGWYKNGKANGAKAHAHGKGAENDD
jgi:hypothetical protein